MIVKNIIVIPNSKLAHNVKIQDFSHMLQKHLFSYNVPTKTKICEYQVSYLQIFSFDYNKTAQLQNSIASYENKNIENPYN